MLIDVFLQMYQVHDENKEVILSCFEALFFFLWRFPLDMLQNQNSKVISKSVSKSECVTRANF